MIETLTVCIGVQIDSWAQYIIPRLRVIRLLIGVGDPTVGYGEGEVVGSGEERDEDFEIEDVEAEEVDSGSGEGERVSMLRVGGGVSRDSMSESPVE